MLKKLLYVCLIAALFSTSVCFAATGQNAGGGASVEAASLKQLHSESYKEAAAAARAVVPAEALFQGNMEEPDKITFSFFDNRTLLAYQVEVLTPANAVRDVRINGSNLPGSVTVTKTPENIREIVKREYPDASISGVALKQEGNLKYYLVDFKTEKFSANAEVNPVTGAFGKRHLVYVQKTPSSSAVRPAAKQAENGQRVQKSSNPVPPVPAEWTCPACGHENLEGQFCTKCGTHRPAELNSGNAKVPGTVKAVSYRCNLCGWEPKDSDHLPGYCPQCGDVFDQYDIVS